MLNKTTMMFCFISLLPWVERFKNIQVVCGVSVNCKGGGEQCGKQNFTYVKPVEPANG